jgi:mRNA-degrading endonuclease toxin of MazEF toxin-antitoxin module
MARDCVVQCENILSVDRAHLTVSDRIGRLDDLAMRDVVRAVGYVIASDCEPV